MEITEKLGKRIKLLRELRHLTQEELAEKSDTQAQYISALERGQKNATLEVLDKIAKGLGVEPVILFSFDSLNEKISKQDLKRIIEASTDKQTATIYKIATILGNDSS